MIPPPELLTKINAIIKKAYEQNGTTDFMQSNSHWTSHFLTNGATPEQRQTAWEIQGSSLSLESLKESFVGSQLQSLDNNLDITPKANLEIDDILFNEQDIINEMFKDNAHLIELFPILKKYNYFTKDAIAPNLNN